MRYCLQLLIVGLVGISASWAADYSASSSSSSAAGNNHRFRPSSISRSSSSNKGAASATEAAWVELFSLSKSPGSPAAAASVDATVRLLNNNKDDPPPPRKATISKEAFASSVAFLTGISDVFSFRMNKCYVNMMTGNAINLFAAVGSGRITTAFHCALVLFWYAVGGTLYQTLIHLHHDRPQPHVLARSAASPIIVAAMALSDVLFAMMQRRGTQHSLRSLVLHHVMPLAFGFGIVNAANTDATGGTITFVYTGHLNKVAQGISDWLFATVTVDSDSSSSRRKRRKTWQPATQLSARIFGFFCFGVLVGTRLATWGTDHVVMPASGMTMATFLVGNPSLSSEAFHNMSTLPLFTILGICYVAMIQLYDRPIIPNLLHMLKAVLVGRNNKKHKAKVDISVNRWHQW